MKTPNTTTKLNIMTTVAFTAAQKTSLTEQAKRWQDHLVATIMSDDFEADEDSFRALFQDTLNFSRLDLMSEDSSIEVNSGYTTTNRQSKVKRGKKVKDPNAPTRPPSSYILYLWGDKTDTELFGNGKVLLLKSQDADLIHKDAVSLAATAWKEMNEDERAPYVHRNSELKEVYEKALLTYNSQ